MYRYFKLFIALIMALCLFSSCSLPHENDINTESDTNTNTATDSTDESIPASAINISDKPRAEEAYSDENPVSRGLVAKMVALIKNTKMEIDLMDRSIAFSDTKKEDWYDRYINACVTEGYFDNSTGEFSAMGYLSVSDAQKILTAVNPDNRIELSITEANKDKPISYKLWLELYKMMIEDLQKAKDKEDKDKEDKGSRDNELIDSLGISEKEIVVLAAKTNNQDLPGDYIISDMGAYSCGGIELGGYIDYKIKVLIKDGEIVAFVEKLEESPTINGAYIVKRGNGYITIFVGGAERTYAYDFTANPLPEGNICDIKIYKEKAAAITVCNEKITGEVLKITSDNIEIKDKPVYPIADSIKVYQSTEGKSDGAGENDSDSGSESGSENESKSESKSGSKNESKSEVKWKTLSSIIIGSEVFDYYIKDGEIVAVVMTEAINISKIRVLLNTTGYKGLIHDTVEITSDIDYSVLIGKTKKDFAAGEVFSVSKSDLSLFDDTNRIFAIPSLSTGKIQISSIKRAWADNESPRYRGVLEIAPEKGALGEGGFTIINELSLDEYLYAVVPSEMPSSHGLEAAKVQAVTARSYAYNQFFMNKYHKYGAHIDDSVSCQVYNNIPENEVSINAVTETTGQCLTHNGEVISANYFSTSCGYTANSGEVWANSTTKAFPTNTMEYLKSKGQFTGVIDFDLATEENVLDFFKDNTIESFDSGFSWFRWNTQMTAAELEAVINANIAGRYKANKYITKTLDAGGAYKSTPISSIGKLVDMEIVKRGQGGNIMELKIVGTEATVLIMTEYNIRSLIKPMKVMQNGADITVIRKDGSVLKNQAMLPSAFFAMEKVYNEDKSLKSVTFYGGGNGHGVGMSQNGVKGMIDLGYKFNEILSHYYSGCRVDRVIK